MRETIIRSSRRAGGISFGSEDHGLHKELMKIIGSLFNAKDFYTKERDIVLSGPDLNVLEKRIDEEIREAIDLFKKEETDVSFFCTYKGKEIGLDTGIPSQQRLADLIEIAKMVFDAIEKNGQFRIDYFENIQEIERKVMFILNVKLKTKSRIEDVLSRFVEVYIGKQELTIEELDSVLQGLIRKKMVYISDGTYFSTEKARMYF